MLPKVVLIGTGGTIASRYDHKLGRTVASQRGEDLLAQVPQLAEVAATAGGAGAGDTRGGRRGGAGRRHLARSHRPGRADLRQGRRQGSRGR
jgi:hypothetical protein